MQYKTQGKKEIFLIATFHSGCVQTPLTHSISHKYACVYVGLSAVYVLLYHTYFSSLLMILCDILFLLLSELGREVVNGVITRYIYMYTHTLIHTASGRLKDKSALEINTYMRIYQGIYIRMYVLREKTRTWFFDCQTCNSNGIYSFE